MALGLDGLAGSATFELLGVPKQCNSGCCRHGSSFVAYFCSCWVIYVWRTVYVCIAMMVLGRFMVFYFVLYQAYHFCGWFQR